MADAAVSMLLKRLGPLIEKKVKEEVSLLLNASKEAETLSSKLEKIQQVLVDAEQKGVMDVLKTPSSKIESWLEKLEDISYDINDVLDEWEMENLKQQFEEAMDASESSNHPWEKVSSFLQSVCLCFKQSIDRRSIALNMKQLNVRLDLIAQENENEFKFIPNLIPHSQDFKRITSTSFVDVSEVQGRDDDLETLMGNLLPTCGEDGIQIVSIVGAGGMGKTTLAQLAFNNDRVQTQFEVKIWVCVSDPFDEIKIANAILEDLEGNSPNLSQFQALLRRIERSVSRKKFLLVLDDVWTKNDTMWKPLKISLIKNGAPGSRILVTTRNIKVAEIMGSSLMQSLSPLSDSYCWSVLSRIAFHGRNDGDCKMLKETGWEIAMKCKGLPLAAKTMGGLLHDKTSLREWQDVLKSELWKLEEVRTDLFPFLALSYNEFHPAVKRCFTYCAIFPKNFRIDVADLIKIWMAQGFLSSSGTVGEMEVNGRAYFNDLAMRSFFQDFEKDEDNVNCITHCQMHDIIHDFAQFMAKNECLIVEKVVGEAERQRVSGKKARHLNLLTTMDPDSICDIEKLCSFFCTESEIPINLLSRLKRVRLLRLEHCELKDIPREIGNLIHLRYLNLQWNDLLKELPETICDLYNLQTLDLSYCQRLVGLPQGIHKLVNLRHLRNLETSRMFEFPQGFEKLTNLQTLDVFNCGSRLNNNKLRYLKDLNQLGGTLTLRIRELDDVVEAEKANLKNKKFIQHLSLVNVGQVELRIIEALQPHPNLPSLRIFVAEMPKWIATLNNLRNLWIGCERIKIESWHSLSNLPFLEKLIVQWLRVEHLGLEFLGINKAAFPKLKILIFGNCYGLKEWEDIKEEDENSDISILPCLEKLIFYDCGDLKGLPHRLLRKVSSLHILDIVRCYYLAERYGEGIGEEWDKISHIPHIYIR